MPNQLDDGRAIFELHLEADENVEFEVSVIGGCCDASSSEGQVKVASFDGALASRRLEIAHSQAQWARVSASNELFNSLLQRSAAD